MKGGGEDSVNVRVHVMDVKRIIMGCDFAKKMKKKKKGGSDG